jgi:SAM-dependent methyltransferase
MSSPNLVETWPAGGRRDPPRSGPTYLLLSSLSAWIQRQAREAHERYGRYRLLDVGCGAKPYYPFFEPYVREYVGVDPVHPGAEVRGTVEDIPVSAAGYDVVLCTQVLEHCADPDLAVRELRRVTAPGGRVLASTHGVMVYHPSPEDLWRWTHAGLERLFERNGEWAKVTVTPNAGTASCVATVLAVYTSLLAEEAHVAPLGGLIVRGLNRLGPLLDRSSRRLREPGPGSMFFNYHVLAEAPG